MAANKSVEFEPSLDKPGENEVEAKGSKDPRPFGVSKVSGGNGVNGTSPSAEGARSLDEKNLGKQNKQGTQLSAPGNNLDTQFLAPGNNQGTQFSAPGNNQGTQLEAPKSSRLVQLCGVCVILTVVAAVLFQSSDFRGITSTSISEPEQMNWKEAEAIFEDDLRKIMKSYSNQTMQTFIHIFSAISSTLNEKTPRQPSPLVFLTPPTVDIEFGSCLARNIGKKVNAVFRNVTHLVNPPDVLELGPDYLNDESISVTDIHEKLKTYLEKGKFVIINNPQEVTDKDRIMVFHAFCDNSAAPQKRATFIFVIPVPEPIYNEYHGKPENDIRIADDILYSSWSSVEPDKRRATITRVAASATMLNPGDSCN